jgi:uncharacterized protein YPO0396
MADVRPKIRELNGRAVAIPGAFSAENGAEPDTVLQGYRLHRLEVLNWGTFDGLVHSMSLDGQTTLLVGQNGAGKSTLVDALLTLLVKPSKYRSYNLAAGAKQTERSEKSYILGAFDRRSQEETNRGEVQYLRGHATYSVLLAVFRNRATNQAFTLAVILFLKDGTPDRLYCFANEDRSIARDISGLKGVDKLAQEMKRRGFKAAGYTEYFESFRRLTGLKDQAMDMFTQTVAVKDIQRLNDFIRKHMLEAKPWSEKVDELFKHFKDLSDAHRELERVRQQRDLLLPIEKHGAEYNLHAEQLKKEDRILAATASYFPKRIIELIEPEIARCQTELNRICSDQQRLKSEIEDGQEQCRKLKNEIDQAGGDRMREIPALIDMHTAKAQAKRSEFARLLLALDEAGLIQPISNQSAFDTMRGMLTPLREQLEKDLDAAKEDHANVIQTRPEPVRQRREADEELQLLKKRQGNLPPAYVQIRQHLCEELNLTERDLPFAAELIAVKPDQHEWEASIEMALRGFALSLLVPQRHYQIVNRAIEETRLRDGQGRGQKLVYHKVTGERQAEGPSPGPQSVYWKFSFRDNASPLLPWVKAELQEKHNIRCCDTIEELQHTHDRAMTRNRHMKLGPSRHEKDDRDRTGDPRYFVLGWDNKEKKRRLAEIIEALTKRISEIDLRAAQLDQAAKSFSKRIHFLDDADRTKSFLDIDYFTHEQQIMELRNELKALQDNNDTIRLLNQRLAEHQERVKALELNRERWLREEESMKRNIVDGQRLVKTQDQILATNAADGSLAMHTECFAELDRMLADDRLSLVNLGQCPDAFRRSQDSKVRQLREELKPLEEIVRKAMFKFLKENPEEKFDLDDSIEYLPDYLKLLDRIQAEDLPRFEDRFKIRLNEKVGQEIGVLRGNLNTERTEIDERIQLLNVSLRKVPFGNGSHMKLVARPVHDAEIGTFRKELDACVTGQFEGTAAADEARFKQIESLITKLREEERWRLKVTDVRNWFDFAAVETDDATGTERSYYDDSAGQSGGEKAKLAFAILIAAIAFQYDLDPEKTNSNRFHFVVVDEMFSRVDDGNSAYALELFRKFGLQLLIVAPLDAKARVTEEFVGCYLHVSKDEESNRSQVLQMTAHEFNEQATSAEGKPRKSR